MIIIKTWRQQQIQFMKPEPGFRKTDVLLELRSLINSERFGKNELVTQIVVSQVNMKK